MKIILDMGSGETCKNDVLQVRDMITSVAQIDNREHEIIFKWQLFTKWGNLRPLFPGIFAMAYDFARAQGYSTTASVFDKQSLNLLSRFEIPFVKIACVPDVRNALIDDCCYMGWWDKEVVVSFGSHIAMHTYDGKRTFADINKRTHKLCCIREYPAEPIQYEKMFADDELRDGISDHTDHTLGMYLAANYTPEVYETHYCLPYQTGPDTGVHALRPNQLETMLEWTK